MQGEGKKNTQRPEKGMSVLRKGEECKRGREHEMNEELKVRESSLSYVIGSMNNNSTRESGDNDPCG